MSVETEALFIFNSGEKSRNIFLAHKRINNEETIKSISHHHNEKSFAFNSENLARSWFQTVIDSSHLITFFISIVVIIYASFKSLRIDKQISENSAKNSQLKCDCLQKQTCLKSDENRSDNIFEKKNSANINIDDNSDSDSYSEDDDGDHGIMGKNSTHGSVQTIDSKLALFIPVAASMSLLLMFFFFDSIQAAFVICTSSLQL